MRVVMLVACCIFTACHHHDVAFLFLGLVGYDVSLALLGGHITDDTFLCLQVVGHLVRLILVFLVLEYGPTFPLFAYGVIHTRGKDSIAVHLASYVVGLQIHIFVFHISFSVQHRCAVAQ